MMLSAAEMRAMRAVRDGNVWQRFNTRGNTFDGPPGIGAIVYRRLQERGMIENDRGEGTRVTGIVSRHRQRLTTLGQATLDSYGQQSEHMSRQVPKRGRPK